MAIGVRDITNLEELLEVQDDDKIIVIQNGEAKLVSKANAKFGGGTVTVFYVDADDQSEYKRLADVNGNPISAQAAYDAVMSGLVYIYNIIQGDTATIHSLMLQPLIGFMKTGETIVTVLFEGDRHTFYAGSNPIH